MVKMTKINMNDSGSFTITDKETGEVKYQGGIDFAELHTAKEILQYVMKYMEEKSGTVDKPRALTFEETYEVYRNVKEAVNQL